MGFHNIIDSYKLKMMKVLMKSLLVLIAFLSSFAFAQGSKVEDYSSVSPVVRAEVSLCVGEVMEGRYEDYSGCKGRLQSAMKFSGGDIELIKNLLKFEIDKQRAAIEVKKNLESAELWEIIDFANSID